MQLPTFDCSHCKLLFNWKIELIFGVVWCSFRCEERKFRAHLYWLSRSLGHVHHAMEFITRTLDFHYKLQRISWEVFARLAVCFRLEAFVGFGLWATWRLAENSFRSCFINLEMSSDTIATGRQTGDPLEQLFARASPVVDCKHFFLC